MFKKGFTLIEVLIVLSIIILFSSFSFAAYNTFNEERTLDDEARKFVNVVNLAQKKASAGEDAACNPFQGYVISTTASPSYYTLRRCCAGDCTDNTVTSEIQRYVLRANNTFTNSDTKIHYKVLSKGTNLNSTTTITIKNSKINKCIKIDISPAGLVTQYDKVSC